MSRKSITVLLLLVFLHTPTYILAGDILEQADTLYDKGGLENYQKTLSLCLKTLENNPDSYDFSWRCARVYRRYGEEAKREKLEGWEEICKDYGEKGMVYAQKAIELNPDKPEGHYYYSLSVGTYSDGVSILTALAEGLKGKTQTGFEKAYEVNPMMADAGPILALGRFWAVLPWPYKNKKKALEYYREYEKTPFFNQSAEGKIYLAELLLKIGGEKNKAEAESLLKKAAQSKEAYFSKWAKDILLEIKSKSN